LKANLDGTPKNVCFNVDQKFKMATITEPNLI
jgi:hypothetical protein